ncbi:2-dehydropantoate 2-reductase [Streptomyces coelicoflavus]|uniref:ketopantoate reductase family protein n=1 Tax=Streptomyces TaxID=1883 RepID=UPI001290A1C1|nr:MULTISPECIES: 2-dehydropantoate 2-reductase [Streptomyces]MCX5041353.1 2-dehydropantoate 2-reductase [Streptomyces coelicoflavus]QFX79618.1 2-dehydropantoate 2-reductase [Streptomyces sp. SYP-A7193]
MRIAVIGAGGVGGYFGARLAAAGNEVTFVARGGHLEAVRRNGLVVHSPLGELRTSPDSVVGSVSELGPTDLVLVAVKLWDTETVADQLRSSEARNAPVLSLQNGVHKDAVLRDRLTEEQVLGGVCFISAFIEEPGVVRHNSPLQKVVLGPYGPGPTETGRAVLAAFRDAGIDAEGSDDIERVIWEKFVFLVGLSATTATVRRPIGVVRAHERSRALLYDVMAETVAVARASGVRLDSDFAQDRLDFCDTLPAAMTSSMHNDLDKGNRLELPWLSGGVVELAGRLDVPVPRNRTVADILAPHVLGRPAGS